MITIMDAFKVKVGYSDHTLGTEIPIAAVTMGAVCIEKHFTLDKNMEGPDHKASLEPEELKKMVLGIRNIEKALGNGIKQPSRSERKNIPIARKSIHLTANLPFGHVLRKEDLIMKRPGDGISPMNIDVVVGQNLTKNKKEDEMLRWQDISATVSIYYKPATKELFEDFYFLKSDNNNMYWTGHTSKPNPSDLKNWFSKQLLNEERDIYLFYKIKEACVGYLYVDFLDSGIVEIAYGIHEDFIGRGLGTNLIHQSIEIIRTNYPEIIKITAWVISDNVGSIEILLKNSFKVTGVKKEMFLKSFKKMVLFEMLEMDL